MKRSLTAIIILFALCLTALIGCESDEYRYEKFYGVVKWSEVSNQNVVYIPEIGDVTIPSAKKCLAGFDGYEESENTSYEPKVGDLVAINFKYEKSWDDNSVKILESYPAQFDRSADVIEALMENVGFEKTDSGYILSLLHSDKTRALTVGDSVALIQHKTSGSFDKAEIAAEGKVIELTDIGITIKLDNIVSERDFLETLLSVTIKKK